MSNEVSGAGAPETANNLINDDVILRQLLKELPGVKTQFQFKGWQKSFLDRYHYLLNEDGVAKASAKYEEFQKLVLKLMKQILSLKDFYDKGEVKPERTSVKALSCIQELSKQIIAVTDEQVAMIPGTGQREKEAGYTKFMMGVVLVKDDFKQHGRLVMCAESLARFHKVMSACINDRFVLETMENFGWKLQLFCDIMSDLGLYQAMTKSQELVPVPEPLIEIASEHDRKKDEQALQADSSETMVSDLPNLVEAEAGSNKSVEDEALGVPIDEEEQGDRILRNTLIVEDTDEEVVLRSRALPGKLSTPLKSDTAVASRPKPGKLIIEEHQPAPRPGLIESPRRRLRNLKRFYPNKSAGKHDAKPYSIKLDVDSEDEPDYSQSSSSETVMTVQTDDVDYILGESQPEQTPPRDDQSPSDSINVNSGRIPQTSSSDLKRSSRNARHANGAANPYQIPSNVDSEDKSEYSQSSSSETVMTVQTEDTEHIFGKKQAQEVSAEVEDRINDADTVSRKKDTGSRTSLSNYLSLTPERKPRRKSRRLPTHITDTDGAKQVTEIPLNAEAALTKIEPNKTIVSTPNNLTGTNQSTREIETEPNKTAVSAPPHNSKVVRNDLTGTNQSTRDIDRGDAKQDGPLAEDTVQSGDAPNRQSGNPIFGDMPITGKNDKETDMHKGKRDIVDQDSPAADDQESLYLEENNTNAEENSIPADRRKQKSESLSPAASNQRDSSMPPREIRNEGEDNIDKPPDSSTKNKNNTRHEPSTTNSRNSDTKSKDMPDKGLTASTNATSPSHPSRKIKDNRAGDSQPMTPKPNAMAKIPLPSPRSTKRDKKDPAAKAKNNDHIQSEQTKGGGEGKEKVIETVVIVADNSYSASTGGNQLDTRVLRYVLAYLSSRESILGEDVYKHNVHVVKSLEEFGEVDAATGFVAATSAQGRSSESTLLYSLIANADCYIVVSSDQTYSIPLMGHFDKQCYRAKCAGILIYSCNSWCEMRGAVSISMMCHDLGCLPVSSFCCFPKAGEMIDGRGELVEENRCILDQLPQMLVQLEWTAVAFKNQRASVGVPF